MSKRKKWMAIIALALAATTFSSCSLLDTLLSKGSGTAVKEEEEMAKLEISLPIGDVYPYVRGMKDYLEAGALANVGTYGRADNQYQGFKIEWECDAQDVVEYHVEYATKSNYSDLICESATDNSIELFNLFKATTYYLRVTAYNSAGVAVAKAEETFKTTDLGPRVMKVGGIYNVRDLGGYQTTNGERTVQGLLYRGGSLTPADVYPHNLTESGQLYMSEVMKIKTEIDFRSYQEAGNIPASRIPGANLTYITLGGYSDAFRSSASAYKDAFLMFANKNNYPIYIHCTGGADRTGTVSFLLNALLGVSELECVQDYEVTTFSIYGERNTQEGIYSEYFRNFRNKLETYEGDTLQEKVETYLLSIGLTEKDISNIKAIMYGKK